MMAPKRKPATPTIPDGPGIGPWEICDDPNCNHASHGSLTRVVQILLGAQLRLLREDPQKYEELVARARARREAWEARDRAAASGL